jgi:hypothetical protein
VAGKFQTFLLILADAYLNLYQERNEVTNLYEIGIKKERTHHHDI